MKLTQEQIEELNIQTGQKITVVSCGGGTAMRKEITVLGIEKGHLVYKLPRKRKKSYITLTDEILIFNNWGHPFELESDKFQSVMFDFQFNFIGDSKTIKDYIDQNNINKLFKDKSRVIAVTPSEAQTDDRVEVYPIAV